MMAPTRYYKRVWGFAGGKWQLHKVEVKKP